MSRKIFTLLLFAVMMFVVGVTAATADWVEFPELENLPNALSSFLPIVFSSNKMPQVEGPSGTLYVFSTTAKTTGMGGGRVGMYEKCAAEDPNAHFCEIGEIYNAVTTSGVVFNTSLTQETWVDAVGFETDVNWSGLSCGGFNSEDNEGYVIEPKAADISSQLCSSNLPVACCKWVP